MLERFNYSAALYLSALIAVVHWSFVVYAQWYLPRLGYGIAIYGVGALVILAGLWLQSRIARYAGAAFYLLCGAAAVIALWGFDKPVNVTVVWAVAIAVLSPVAAAILVFSKSFAREFAAEREKRPPYKKHLLNAFTFVIVLATTAGILIDIVHFASN